MAPESRTRAPGSLHLDPGSPSPSPPREPAVKRNPKGRPKGSLNKVQKAHENSTKRDPSRWEIVERDSQREAAELRKTLEATKGKEKDEKKEAASQKRKENAAKRKAEKAILVAMRQGFEKRQAAKAAQAPTPENTIVPSQRRQRRRALSEDPDDYVPELGPVLPGPVPHGPVPRQQGLRHPVPSQHPDDYDPELDND